MRTVVAALAALATAGAVGASEISKRTSGGGQAVYWGQFDSERSLGSYCASKEGIDIIVLAFLGTFGGGATPQGQIGNDCQIDSNGNGHNCGGLAKDIQTCKNAGKKVFLSLGGGGNPGHATSKGDAQGVAYTLWNSYANPNAMTGSSPRPFGNTFVDGWDFDIEQPNGAQYLGDIVNSLRGYFSKDSGHHYYISGAPQCYHPPDDNMGASIKTAQYDYLFVQFYNNPPCSAYQYVRPDSESGSDGFNFDTWYNTIQSTASKNAKLLIGLPASTQASGYENEPGTKFYIKPDGELPKLLNAYKSHAGFGGVMLWDAGDSDIGKNNAGCTYDQSVRSILDTGRTCSDPSNPSSATPAQTTLVTKTSTQSSQATCSWMGHCQGATCSNDNDCADPYSCQNGKCT